MQRERLLTYSEGDNMTLLKEIFEQPTILERLLTSQRENIEVIAQKLQTKEWHYVFLAGRGTSDNAGRYAQYLWGSYNRIPIALGTPSLFSIYGQPPLLKGALVIGVSQSGQSPDILSVIVEGKRQGRPTLAITNDPASPLAQEADFVIDINAGEERAVAATKSYTAQLMVMAILSNALQKDTSFYAPRLDAMSRVPEWVEQCLMLDEQIDHAVQRYRYMDQCVVLGRGYNYATAFEWSLKLKELCYVSAEPYSSADFLHGPVAVIERGYPIMAVNPGGAVYESIYNLLADLQQKRRAEILTISDKTEALDQADIPLPLPQGIPEWLSPIVSIIPAQLVGYHLTQAKGYDTEAPRGLEKVTKTE